MTRRKARIRAGQVLDGCWTHCSATQRRSGGAQGSGATFLSALLPTLITATLWCAKSFFILVVKKTGSRMEQRFSPLAQ